MGQAIHPNAEAHDPIPMHLSRTSGWRFQAPVP